MPCDVPVIVRPGVGASKLSKRSDKLLKVASDRSKTGQKMAAKHGGDDLEDDFVPDDLVALSDDETPGNARLEEEDIFIDDEGQTPEEEEDEAEEVKAAAASSSQTALSEKKRKRREKEKERKVCFFSSFIVSHN